jgi:dTDP-glucose pyrophosphorylase
MPNSEDSLTTESWEKALLPINATLQEAISNLEETAFQIAIIATPDRIMVGTLTDGDIRRGLLRGMSMDSTVEQIIYSEPLVVPPRHGRDSVLQLMKVNQVHQIPVVDEERRVVGLHLWDEIVDPCRRPNIMVIMVGGQGSRLRPHTENCPKPMLHVGGKPMLEHIIERAKGAGFQNFVLATHYLGEKFEEYFGNGNDWDVKIDYLHEESPLGTAGAIGLLDPKPNMPFLVTNGDILTDIHYDKLLDYHYRYSASATMAVSKYQWQHPFGVVHTDGVDIAGFEEKPISISYINAGIYVLSPNALDVLSHDEHCDMPTLFSRLQKISARTVVYPMHEPWLDVGQVESYTLAKKNIQNNSSEYSKVSDSTNKM